VVDWVADIVLYAICVYYHCENGWARERLYIVVCLADFVGAFFQFVEELFAKEILEVVVGGRHMCICEC